MEGLFALGSNGSGQLGIGHKEDVSVPKPVLFEHPLPSDDEIVKIAAGGNHTILVTKSGRAYWSGDASTGACGIVASTSPDNDADSSSLKFREVILSKTESLGLVADVACTWDTSVFALRDSEGKATKAYACGGESAEQPNLLADFPPAGSEVRALAAGFRHVVAVLDNGDVYGWGNGRKGQIGVLMEGAADAKGVVPFPTKISGVSFPVAMAVCCQYTTCLIAEPGDGQIAVLGADKWALRSSAPPAVPNWKTIAASWGGIYVLKYDGTLEAWGRDDHGQLPPPGVPRIESIAAGSEHVVGFTDNKEVVSWGWGEHGNCGPQTERFGDVKGRWNTIASLKNLPEGSDITLIGAGCATSWVFITADGIFL